MRDINLAAAKIECGATGRQRDSSLDHQSADESWNPDQLKPTLLLLLSRKRHE